MSLNATALRDARRQRLAELYERVAAHQGDEVADVLRTDPDMPQLGEAPTISIAAERRQQNVETAKAFGAEAAERVAFANGDPRVFAAAAAARSRALPERRATTSVELPGAHQSGAATGEVAAQPLRHVASDSAHLRTAAVPLIRDVRIVRVGRDQGGLPSYGARGGLPSLAPIAQSAAIRRAAIQDRGPAL